MFSQKFAPLICKKFLFLFWKKCCVKGNKLETVKPFQNLDKLNQMGEYN